MNQKIDKIKESDLFDCLIIFFLLTLLSVGLTTYFNYSNNQNNQIFWLFDYRSKNCTRTNNRTECNFMYIDLIIWLSSLPVWKRGHRTELHVALYIQIEKLQIHLTSMKVRVQLTKVAGVSLFVETK